MALSPDVVVVAPGELITAAHLNNVRANLDRLDTTKYDKTGGTVTGNVTVTGTVSASGNVSSATAVRSGGNPWTNAEGVSVEATGIVQSAILATPSQDFPNLGLGRAGFPGNAGKPYLTFARGATGLPYAQQVGSIVVNAGGNGVVYNTTSDRRLKDVLGDVVDAVARLCELQPRHLAWKDGGGEFDSFIADEVAAVVPVAVTGEPDAVFADDHPFTPGAINPQQLDVSQLIPLLVAAVQELAGRVVTLEGGAG